jgi:hypothetical protein
MSGLRFTMPKGLQAELKKKNREFAASTRGSTRSTLSGLGRGCAWMTEKDRVSDMIPVKTIFGIYILIF